MIPATGAIVKQEFLPVSPTVEKRQCSGRLRSELIFIMVEGCT